MIADITLREFIAGLFLAGGAFFLLASAIGMLRLPDFTAGCMLPATARRWGSCCRSWVWSFMRGSRSLH